MNRKTGIKSPSFTLVTAKFLDVSPMDLYTVKKRTSQMSIGNLSWSFEAVQGEWDKQNILLILQNVLFH